MATLVEPWAHFTFYLFTEHRTALLISFRSLSNTLATLCVLAARWCGGLRAAPSAHSVRLGSRLGSQKAPGSGLAPSPTLTGPSVPAQPTRYTRWHGAHPTPTSPRGAAPTRPVRPVCDQPKHQTEDSLSPQTPNCLENCPYLLLEHLSTGDVDIPREPVGLVL